MRKELLAIDPTKYPIAHKLTKTAVTSIDINVRNPEREAQHPRQLRDLAVMREKHQTNDANATAV
jgi:hypothetical protein